MPSSSTDPTSLPQPSSEACTWGSLDAPLAPLLIGVTGNTDPVGYDATVTDPASMDPAIQQIYQRLWDFLDWVFGEKTVSPIPVLPSAAHATGTNAIAIASSAIPNAKPVNGSPASYARIDVDASIPRNRRDFWSGKLEAYHDAWRPLNVVDTPVVLLSSIAPGIDTLAAEVFLEYRHRNPHRPVFVKAPVPFPLDCLERCSSYSKPEDKARFGHLLARLRAQPGWNDDHDLFCVKIDRDWEPIAPHRDLAEPGIILCEAQNALAEPLSPESDLESTIEYRGQPQKRRHLRYRAAGETVASLSHILLAIYDHHWDEPPSATTEASTDETPDEPEVHAINPFDPGTAAIVEAKRRGLSWELLATSNNFSWADNGPVLRLGITRKKRLAALAKTPSPTPPSESPDTWAFLQPYDLKPETHRLSRTQREARWQANGDFVMRKILTLQEGFNRDAKKHAPRDGGSGELLSMFVPKTTASDLQGKRQYLETTLGPDMVQRLRRLEPAACIRRCAGDLASKVYERTRFYTLLVLIGLIFIAAMSLGMFEHWHRIHPVPSAHDTAWWQPSVLVSMVAYASESKSDRTEAWIRAGLLIVTLVSLTVSCLWYMRYRQLSIEQKRFDYRAVAEALRVQIYWSVAGLNRSVASDYMQRQRDELDWIRYVVSNVTFPFDSWSRRFAEASAEVQVELLTLVRLQWVQAQADHFTKNVTKLSHQLHLTHVLCWAAALAGLIQIPLMLACQLSPTFQAWLDGSHARLFRGAMLLSLPGLFLLLAFALELAVHVNKWMEHALPGWLKRGLSVIDDHFGEHAVSTADSNVLRNRFSVFVFYLQQWGAAIAMAAIALELSYALPHLGEHFPDRANWWIITTGACLLLGALILAWGERSFYAELYRSYCSMRLLYRSADRRLEHLLEDLNPQSSASGSGHVDALERQRLVMEAQDILYQLGCEALNENAEWLILHRARPLEPFMAG